MSFHLTPLDEGQNRFVLSRLREWYDIEPLIEADPPKDPRDAEDDDKKKKDKNGKKKPGGKAKGPDEPGKPDQIQVSEPEPREPQEAPPPKPVKPLPIQKEKPPHNLKNVEKRSKAMDKKPVKKISSRGKLHQVVQSRHDRRADLQDLSKGGLGSFITWRLKPRTRYGGY